MWVVYTRAKLSDKVYRVEANCAAQQGRPVYNWKTTQEIQVKTHSVEKKVPRQLYGLIRQALELIRDKIMKKNMFFFFIKFPEC